MPHDGWHPHDHAEGLDHGAGHRHRHESPTRRFVLAAASFLPFGGASSGGVSAQGVDAAQRIAEGAIQFLSTLDDGQRRKVLIAYDAANRLDWHYVPRGRAGLGLGEMRPAQADAARRLFASVLNDEGLRLLDGVRLLEGILREQQGSWRDPGRYFVSIFGTPGRLPWGWRFEGHHLSLNVALPGPGVVSVTPFFVGAHPAAVRSGPHRGFRLLGTSEDLARQVMASLDDQQRRAALIASRSLGDIVASPQRERDLGEPRGLALAAMDGPTRRLVEALMDSFLGTLSPELVATQKRRVMEQGLDRFRFAWGGSLQPGDAYYFRVHGPATLIEHDNSQNDANHVHSVWRDLGADFGLDALAEHYRRDPHR